MTPTKGMEIDWKNQGVLCKGVYIEADKDGHRVYDYGVKGTALLPADTKFLPASKRGWQR